MKSGEILIRKAKKGDEGDVGRLLMQFWKDAEKRNPILKLKKNIGLRDYVNSAKKRLLQKKKNNFLFVAEIHEKIVGYLEFKVNNNIKYCQTKKYGYLETTATDKKFRKKGIASALINEAFKFLKKKGIFHVRALVSNKNNIARKAWAKVGFYDDSTLIQKNLK